MATTIGTTVALNEGSPSIRVTSNVEGGAYPPTVYIRKENITLVNGAKQKRDLQIDGTFDGYKFEVEITTNDGSVERIDISEVQNQVTWTVDDAGLAKAIDDIAQSA